MRGQQEKSILNSRNLKDFRVQSSADGVPSPGHTAHVPEPGNCSWWLIALTVKSQVSPQPGKRGVDLSLSQPGSTRSPARTQIRNFVDIIVLHGPRGSFSSCKEGAPHDVAGVSMA